MQSYQRQYLKEMGVDVWLDKDTPVVINKSIAEESITEKNDASKNHTKEVNGTTEKFSTELDSLAKQVAACQQCSLHATRTQTVFGVGNPNADWLVIGEAPGADEDRQGEPFVGRAGKLLNSMLLAMGLPREQVFIANILKCRPPNNRDPRADEVTACETYLCQQIDLIRPKIILVVGRIAAQNLLKLETPIGKMRGNCYQYQDSELPVVVTYHPAYLLRSPREKRKVWEDLKFAMQTYKALV